MGKLCDVNGYIQFSDNDMNFETEDYEHFEKCGEIYFSETGRFELYCNLCDERFIDYNIFFGSKHLEKHFTFFDENTSSEKKENKAKVSSTAEEITVNDKVQEQNDKFLIQINDFDPVDNALNILIKDLTSLTSSETTDSMEAAGNDSLSKVPYNVRKLTCHVCFETFTKSSYRDRHVLKYHKDQYKGKYYTCTYCENDFLHKSHFEQHVRKHTGERPFTCKNCDKSFISVYNLNVHNSRYHKDLNPYFCRVDNCNSSFKSWITRLKHERSHSRLEELPFKCKECDKKFANAGDLTRHVRFIHMDKVNLPYECHICSRSFHQKRLLKYHIFTHTGEKPYGCKVCNARFSKPSILSQHKLLHSGTKKYVCSICDERFFQSAGLSAHKRKKNHYDEEP